MPSIHSVTTFCLLIVTALAAAIPSQSRWSTPSSCLRGVGSYDYKQCSGELNELIQFARESIREIEIVGRRLVDVIGPTATVLPYKFPVTHSCYPTHRLREQGGDNAMPDQYRWSHEDFVPFRLNLQCDDEDRIVNYSWH